DLDLSITAGHDCLIGMDLCQVAADVRGALRLFQPAVHLTCPHTQVSKRTAGLPLLRDVELAADKQPLQPLDDGHDAVQLLPAGSGAATWPERIWRRRDDVSDHGSDLAIANKSSCPYNERAFLKEIQMDIKPNTNITDADQDNRGSTTHVGGDQNVVNGQSVIAVVGGSGAIQADKIAIGDIYGDAAAPSSPAEFAELVSSLADLITEAKNAGELPDTMAAKAISSLVETTELIKKEEKPPKSQV